MNTKKVKCIRAPKGCWLTLGKIYQAEELTGWNGDNYSVIDYFVYDDRGKKSYYRAKKFEPVDCPCHVHNCLRHIGK